MSEYREHRAVCQYLKVRYPNTIFLSDASGVRVSMGVARQIKPLKSSRGIPDIIILEPRGGFHGLLIEIKATGVKVFKKNGEIYSDDHIKEQWEVLKRLQMKGYKAVFACGQDEAMSVVDKYMSLSI